MFVPVVDQQNNPLMPTSPARARRWVKSGKATPFWSFGIWCVRLNIEPSARNIQDVAIGIDPGSKREGFTVKSKDKTFINVQSKAVTWVKDKVDARRNLRKSRRYRKTPCRQPRWSNRRSGKPTLAPSTKARWQLKLRILNRLLRLYPIQFAVIEDVQASTKEGKRKAYSFQMIMQGKLWLYGQIRKLDLVLMLAQGYETSQKRKALGLSKTSNKMAEKFSAHCVDSWVLASMAVGGVKPDNESLHLVDPMQKHYRNLHVQNFAKGGVRKNYGSTRSMGFERGSIIKHPVYGVCLVGGTSNQRISLHAVDGQRVTRSVKAESVKFLAFNSYNYRTSH